MADSKTSEEEAREYAESIINTVRESLIVLNHDLRVISASRSFYDTFQLKPEEAEGWFIYDLGNKQWNLPRLRQLLEILLPQKTVIEGYEIEHEFAELGRRTMLLNAREIQRKSRKERLILLAIEDITERKGEEEAQRKSEEKFRTIFNSSSDAIFIHDSSGRLLEVNNVACERLGYTRDELLEMTLMDIDTPEAARIAPEHIRHLHQEGFISFEGAHQRKDGQQFPVEITSRLIDYEGETWILSTVRDITKRKQAEEALQQKSRELEERVKELDCLYSLSRLMEQPGISRQELMQSAVEIVPFGWQYPDMTCARLLLEGEAFYSRDFRETAWKQSADILVTGSSAGRIEVFYLQEAPECDEGPFLSQERELIGTIAERLGQYLEREQTREALLRSESYYRAIFETSGSAMSIVEEDTTIFLVNSNFERLSGYSREEVEGRMSLTEFVHPEDVVWMKEYHYLRRRDPDAAPCQYEYRFIDRHGQKRDLLLSVDMIPGTSQSILAGVDITEHKHVEQALRESESRVRTKLNALLDPEGDIGDLNLADVVDCEEIQSLMNDFHALTDIGVGIIDLEGTLLVGTGWQDVCTKFHRVHPETAKRCRESDTALVSDVEPGTFKIYKCKNNMWDMATPVMIGEKHVGNLFLGQFFFENETPDIATFREQARRYGFDEEAYLEAYRSIPRWSREKINKVMTFYCNLIGVIARRSYAQIKLARTTEALKASNTKLNNAMQVLRKSEEKWHSYIQNAPFGVFVTDEEGRYVEVNPAACEATGYSEEELLTMSIPDLIPPGSERENLEHFQRLRNTDFFSGVTGLLRKDGQVRRWSVNAVKLSENRFLGFAEDVTERSLMAESLRQSEERFRAANEASLDALLLLNSERDETGEIRDFIFVDVNRRTEEMLHMSRDQLLGNRLCETLPINREVGFFEKYKCVVDTGIPLDEEFSLSDTHVPAVWYYHQVVKVHDGVFICLRDISARKRAKAEHEKLQEQLDQAQKMESVGRLAGGVAHDFNNKLAIINGYAELAIDMMEPSDPLRATIQEIYTAGNQSAKIVRQLLAFARKQTISPVQLDLNDTISSMLKMLQRLIGENIDLEWHPGNHLWPVKIDPSQVDQVMANLAVNSRDAISDVGKLTIETKNTIVDEDYCKSNPEASPGRYVMLAVSDDGCGIEEEIREQLFDPYFTTKEIGKGTGLGLPTVYGIVKQNNGFINVYSEPGEGTTFKLYFPSHEEANSSLHSAKEASGQIPTGTETVLVVEDENTILKMSRQMLERLGYTVETATSPAEALQISNEYNRTINLLITDVVMPDMNGRDLSARLSKNQPDLKILYMSGYTANVIAHHGVLDEGVQFIQKPFSLKDLAAKVREVLG